MSRVSAARRIARRPMVTVRLALAAMCAARQPRSLRRPRRAHRRWFAVALPRPGPAAGRGHFDTGTGQVGGLDVPSATPWRRSPRAWRAALHGDRARRANSWPSVARSRGRAARDRWRWGRGRAIVVGSGYDAPTRSASRRRNLYVAGTARSRGRLGRPPRAFSAAILICRPAAWIRRGPWPCCRTVAAPQRRLELQRLPGEGTDGEPAS